MRDRFVLIGLITLFEIRESDRFSVYQRQQHVDPDVRQFPRDVRHQRVCLPSTRHTQDNSHALLGPSCFVFVLLWQVQPRLEYNITLLRPHTLFASTLLFCHQCWHRHCRLDITQRAHRKPPVNSTSRSQRSQGATSPGFYRTRSLKELVIL